MPEIWNKKASDKEINACKGNYCGLCKNQDRCLTLYFDRTLRQRVDEHLYNLEIILRRKKYEYI